MFITLYAAITFLGLVDRVGQPHSRPLAVDRALDEGFVIPIHDLVAGIPETEPDQQRHVYGYFFVGKDTDHWPKAWHSNPPQLFIAPDTGDPLNSYPMRTWTSTSATLVHIPDSAGTRNHGSAVAFDITLPNGFTDTSGLIMAAVQGLSHEHGEGRHEETCFVVDTFVTRPISAVDMKRWLLKEGRRREAARASLPNIDENNIIPIEVHRPLDRLAPVLVPGEEHFWPHTGWNGTPQIYGSLSQAMPPLASDWTAAWMSTGLTFTPTGGTGVVKWDPGAYAYQWIMIYAADITTTPLGGAVREVDGVIRQVGH